MTQTLGTLIRERRQDLGLTQEELAERIGESMRQAEISRLEHDRISLPRRDRLESIAAALEVSLGELLVRTGWMTEGDALATAMLHQQGAEATVPEALDTGVMELQTMVEEAAQTLAQTQELIATIRRSLSVIQSPESGTGPRVAQTADRKSPHPGWSKRAAQSQPQSGAGSSWEGAASFAGSPNRGS